MPAYAMNAEKRAPTTKNSDRPMRIDVGVGGQQEQQDEREHHEAGQRLELPGQVRRRALLHGPGDLLHLLGALVGGEHALRSATAKPSATSAITATSTT